MQFSVFGVIPVIMLYLVQKGQGISDSSNGKDTGEEYDRKTH